jgi:hypothetical protein
MAGDPFLIRKKAASWTNFHGTVTVPVRAYWTVLNSSSEPKMSVMRETAARLQGLIGTALKQGVRLRAVGSRWSFSEVAAAEDGWAVETDNLNLTFAVGPGSLDPGYHGDSEELFLAQCGTSLAEIGRKIETPERRRALRTQGASNGQTIAGALGTGTHGSAIDVGALESQVAGIQLLTAERNLWLERPGDPVLNKDFAARLGAELVRDESLFRAALVSLGMLGIVHAVLLRTTGRYRLRSWLKRMKFAEVERAMNSLDFAGANLPGPGGRPYFFQAVVEPSTPADVYVTVRYKELCPPDYVPDAALKTGYEIGNDLPALVGKLLDVAPGLRPALAPVLIKAQLGEFADKLGTPAETYTYTSSRPGVIGASLAMPVRHVSLALALGREAFLAHPGAPCAFACRYARQTPALLGWTRFDPSCQMDIDGVDTEATRGLMTDMRRRFDAAGLPYAQHWGKALELTPARMAVSYGGNVDRWNEVRRKLLPNAAERKMFSLPLFDSIGLNA